jgi:uncharacterized membrane protein YgaE (UPF0421/DUF939 family)
MKIGLRTLKTGLAVTIALLVVQILQLESTLFISIGALIGMQTTVADSWKVGRNRILGTVVGTVFGLLLALAVPGNFLIAGFGVMVLIVTMNRLNIPEGIVISCVVFISIFMTTQPDIFPFAMSRLTDTFFGLVIALLVNYFVFPPKYDRRAMREMRKDMTEILSCQNRMLGILLGRESVTIEEIEMRLASLLDELNESKKLAEMQEKEEKVNVYGQTPCHEINLVLRITTDMYHHLQNLFGLVEKGVSQKAINPLKSELEALYEKLLAEESQLREEKLNYTQKMTDLLGDIATLKNRIKSEDVYRQFGAEESIKMMVIVYNIGEIISKMNMIDSHRNA